MRKNTMILILSQTYAAFRSKVFRGLLVRDVWEIEWEMISVDEKTWPVVPKLRQNTQPFVC